MGAATFVGRVGGLAVALGVGAAVFNGTPLASADDSSPNGPSAGSSRNAGAASADRSSTQRSKRVGSRVASAAATESVNNAGPIQTTTRQNRSVAAPGQSAAISQARSAQAALVAPSTLAFTRRQPTRVGGWGWEGLF